MTDVSPGAGATAPSRSEQRSRKLRRSIQLGFVAKAVSAATRFLTVGLSIRLLGPELYGLWVSAGSMVSWLAFSDLGFSTGIITAITGLSSRGDRNGVRSVISSGYALFTAIGLIVAAACIPLAGSPMLDGLLGIANRPSLVGPAHRLVLVLSIVFGLTLAINTVVAVANALLRPYLATVASIAANLLSVAALFGLAVAGERSVVFYAAASVTPALIANLTLTFLLFGVFFPEYRPSLRLVSTSAIRKIAGPSVFIILSQLGDLAIHYSANLLVSSSSGPGAVPSYSVPYSLFMLAQTVANTSLGPLWPFMAEAHQSGDRAWILRTFRLSTRRTMLLMLAMVLGIVLLGRPVIRIWAGPAAVPSWSLLALMGGYFLVWMFAGILWMLGYGAGYFRLRAILSIADGAVFVGGSYLLVPMLGIQAIPLVGLVVMALDCTVAYLAMARRVLGAPGLS